MDTCEKLSQETVIDGHVNTRPCVINILTFIVRALLMRLCSNCYVRRFCAVLGKPVEDARQVCAQILTASTHECLCIYILFLQVRDHLLEKYQEPLIVRLLDKMAFTIGVLNIVVSEAVLLLAPDKFWMW
jgi:hypothetical protein